MTMRFIFSNFVLVTFLQTLFLAQSAFANASGSICMAKMPGSGVQVMPHTVMVSEPNMTPLDTYIGPNELLTILISGKSMQVSPTQGGTIKGLPVNKRHLVKVNRRDKTVVSFWFDFKKEGSNRLCLWYYRSYGTISLLPGSFEECECQ